MRAEEAAELLRISVKTLANWRSSKSGPPWRKHGGRVVYRRSDVLAWPAEKSGQGKEAKDPLFATPIVSTPKYRKDPARYHVSIMIPDPTNPTQQLRIRKVSEAGLSEERAHAWGMEVGYRLQAEAKYGKVLEEENEPQHIQQEPAPKAPAPPPVPKSKANAPKFCTLWAEYIEGIKNDGTQRLKKSQWKVLAPIVGRTPVNEWTPDLCRKVEKRIAGFGAGYANHVVVILRHLFERAVEDGHILEVPRLPKRRKEHEVEQEEAHAVDEGEALLEAARRLGQERREDWELVLLLGLDLGLRPGEVAGLRWIDVDLTAGTVNVRNQRPDPGFSDRAPKWNGRRKLWLTDRLAEVLETKDRSGTYVVMDREGRAMCTNSITYRVHKTHEAVGLDGDRKGGHFMRHCSASWAIHHGATLGETQDLLGHKRASTTETYIHKVKGSDRAKAAAAVLNRIPRGNGRDNGRCNAVATEGNSVQNGRRGRLRVV